MWSWSHCIKLRYSWGGHMTDLSPYHNVWCTFSLPQWLVLQVQNWTLHVLANHSVPKYNFWWTEWFCCVKWGWNCSHCGGQLCDWKFNLWHWTCGKESMLWTSEIAVFCLQSKNLWLTINLFVTWVLWTGGVILFRLESGCILCWIQV